MSDILIDRQYEDLLIRIRDTGTLKGDRTGTGTKSLFGELLRYDLSKGFPLITTKKVPFRLIAEELLWILMGDSNIKYLVDRNVSIWTEWPFKKYLETTGQKVPEVGSDLWNAAIKAFEHEIKASQEFADKYGDLGPVYGIQWTKWPTPDGKQINQIAEAVRLLKEDPDSRRIIVNAWNPADLSKMALTPCHAFFQFYVAGGKLSCQLDQRSADTVLGVPFNIASYALLIHMVAQQCDLEVGELIWVGGDTHIYVDHLDPLEEQLARDIRPFPTLKLLRKPKSIFDYKFEDFEIEGYDPHPSIHYQIAV